MKLRETFTQFYLFIVKVIMKNTDEQPHEEILGDLGDPEQRSLCPSGFGVHPPAQRSIHLPRRAPNTII